MDSNSKAFTKWIEEQRMSSTIEELTEEIPTLLACEKEYVTVFFTGPYNENAAMDQEFETVLHELENINDDLDDFEVQIGYY